MPRRDDTWRSRTELDAADVNDIREEAKTPPGNLLRLAAALDAVDRELAELDAASRDSGETARIEETRALLRRAIRALAPEPPADAAEDTGSGKRRVKIKAESEVAASSGAVGSPSKSDASTAKPAARGGRNGRRAETVEKVERESLIARLGAAAEATAAPRANDEASAPVVPTGRTGTDKTISGTAERLAQLEAEIADLTERVTATPTADDTPSRRHLAVTETAAGARPDALDMAGDDMDDDDAEITIIGADGARVEPTTHAGRQMPRVFRESPPSLHEEEAEVEIRRSGGAAAGVHRMDRPETIRVSARTTAGSAGSSPRGKWRLFGGSS